MKAPWFRLLLAGVAVASARATDDPLDRVEDALSWSAAGGAARARLSGLLDAEGYAVPDPAPGVIDSDSGRLFVPRLTTFLDAQFGPAIYVFAQARIDRGFDPANEPLRARLDEYAVRWAIGADRRLNLQVGKFATVVGNWAARHDSWTNPFITAPLPYENLTGVWDSEPPRSSGQLLVWSHLRPGLPAAVTATEKYLRLPIIWGPSYASGAALAGEVASFRYALELKSAAVSARPEVWGHDDSLSHDPAIDGRVSWRPSPEWEYGWSFATGAFLRPSAAPLIPRGRTRADYRQQVLGQDLSFSWHHLQLWAEVYGARFEIPPVGHADTLAYYVEARYKFTPQLSGALRWNQQLFGTILDRDAHVPWGRNTWRIDVGPAFRFTPHTQLKLQYSVQRGDTENNDLTHFLALQATLRF